MIGGVDSHCHSADRGVGVRDTRDSVMWNHAKGKHIIVFKRAAFSGNIKNWYDPLDNESPIPQRVHELIIKILWNSLRYNFLWSDQVTSMHMTVTPYLWDSRNIYSKWKGRFSADAKTVLVRQVEHRHKAGFGAAGLGTAQSWFWSRHKAGFGAVGLGAGFGAGTKPVLERSV